MSDELIQASCLRAMDATEFTAGADGLARVRWFPLGMVAMSEGDSRQFEVTEENAARMVATANARIAAGKKPIDVNYIHNRKGPRAARAHRFEWDETGVYGFQKWTKAAKEAITPGPAGEPAEFDCFSPEFFGRRVLDDRGRPVMVDGRELYRPYEIDGGAVCNDPAMTDLRLAAMKEVRMDKELLGRLEAIEATTNTLRKELTTATEAVTRLEATVKTQAETITAQAAQLEALKGNPELDAALLEARADGRLTAPREARAREIASKLSLDEAKAYLADLPKDTSPRGKAGAKKLDASAKGEKGSFADADPNDPDIKKELHEACLAYAAKHKVDYGVAVEDLTTPVGDVN